VQVAFASLSVAGKVVTRTLEPSALALIRLAGAGLVLGVLLARRGIAQPIPRRDLLGIAGCATLGIYLNQVLFLYGLRLTSPVNATVLIATIPVFAVLAAMLLRIEPPRAQTLGGVAIALAGVLFLIGGDLELGGDTVVGDLLVVANSVVYALYLVLIRTYVARHGSITVVAIGFAVATLLALPYGAPVLIAQAPAIEARIWWLALYVVLVPTVFTYLANAWALRFASSSVVAIYIYVQPPVAVLLTWLFLGELPSPRVYVTIAAVFAGIWLVTRPAAGASEAGAARQRR
jgi:drug/metabolite transporter (DMT)-like permease